MTRTASIEQAAPGTQARAVSSEGAGPPRAIALQATWRRLTPELPRALVSEGALRAVDTFVAGMPAMFHWTVLEARLAGAEADPQVDLLSLVMNLGGRSQRRGLAALLEAGRGHPGLSGARSLERWLGEDDAGLEALRMVWLEWDAPFEGRTPLQLFAIDPRFWGPKDLLVTPRQQAEIAARGYEASFGQAHDPRVIARLEAAIACLPRGSMAIFAASLRPRGKEVDRLFVKIAPQHVPTWLGQIGWPGDLAAARHWLGRVIAPWEPAYLQVEVEASGLTPYLGIEPVQTAGTRSERRERERLLGGLVQDGWVDGEKVRALTAWGGTREVELDGEPAREVRSYHLKCVLEPGPGTARPVTIKGYLGVHYL